MTTYWNFDKPVYKKKRFVAKFVRKAPVDCTDFAKNNIPNYNTITSIPDEIMEMDFSDTEILDRAFASMEKNKSIVNIYAPKCKSLYEFMYPYPGESADGKNLSSISLTPYIYIPIAENINRLLSLSSITVFEGNKIIIGEKLFNADAILNSARNLTTICSMFNTKNCISFAHSFSGATNLSEICYFDTRRVGNFTYTFNSSAIASIPWDIDMRCCNNCNSMFNGCKNLIDSGITLINVPRTLDLSNIGCATTKYSIKNYIESPLNPEDVHDDDPVQLS